MWDPRAARVTVTVLAVALAAWLIYEVRGVLFLAVVAIFLSYALEPLVRLVTKYVTGRHARAWALGIVYILLIGLIATAGTGVVIRLSQEVAQLGAKVPEWLAKKDNFLESAHWPGWLEPWRDQIAEAVRSKLASSSEQILAFVQQAGVQTLSVIGNVVYLLLVPILSFLLLRDGVSVRDGLVSILPEKVRSMAAAILRDIHAMLTSYIRALTLLSLITLASFWGFFAISGMPYSYLLAVAAGICEFVPFAGPLIAGTLAVVTGVVAGYDHLGLLVVFLLGYRVVQDYVVQPWLLSEGVELHPLLLILGALAGEELGGIVGLFLATPVMATVRVVWRGVREANRVELKQVNQFVDSD